MAEENLNSLDLVKVPQIWGCLSTILCFLPSFCHKVMGKQQNLVLQEVSQGSQGKYETWQQGKWKWPCCGRFSFASEHDEESACAG